jgi:hypothetical protein
MGESTVYRYLYLYTVGESIGVPFLTHTVYQELKQTYRGRLHQTVHDRPTTKMNIELKLS